MRYIPIVALLAVCAAPLASQGTVIKAGTNDAPVPNPTFETPKNLVYKIAWNISQGAAKPGEANTAFDAPARILNSASTAGVPPANIQLAMVVHGSAGIELLSNAAYRARTGSDNPNIPLLEELARSGVRIIICGQTIARQKLPREQLLPFVQVSLSATWVFAVLQTQGYHVNPF